MGGRACGRLDSALRDFFPFFGFVGTCFAVMRGLNDRRGEERRVNLLAPLLL